MTKEEFENIVKLQSDLKEQSNSKLIEMMDKRNKREYNKYDFIFR